MCYYCAYFIKLFNYFSKTIEMHNKMLYNDKK